MLAIFLALIAPWLLSFFAGEKFSRASSFVVWIALGYAFSGMYYMVVNYIFYAKKTVLLAKLTFFTAILNIGLNYVLITYNGAIGAAQATTITMLLGFVFTWILSNRVYKMPWNLMRVQVL